MTGVQTCALPIWLFINQNIQSLYLLDQTFSLTNEFDSITMIEYIIFFYLLIISSELHMLLLLTLLLEHLLPPGRTHSSASLPEIQIQIATTSVSDLERGGSWTPSTVNTEEVIQHVDEHEA